MFFMRRLIRPPSDDDIIEGIRAGGQSREDMLGYVMAKSWDRFLVEMKKRYSSLTIEDIKDVLQDGIIAFAAQVKANQFRGESKVFTYLWTIVNRKCIDYHRKKKRSIVIGMPNMGAAFPGASPDVLKYIADEIEHDSLDLMERCLQTLSERCRNILSMLKRGFAHEEIALRLALKSVDVSRTTKKRCMEQLRSSFHTSNTKDDRHA